MKTTKKRTDIRLEITTRTGRHGTYLFFRGPKGDYHAFLEVAAKEAARHCGISATGRNGRPKTTKKMCKEL